MAYPQGHGRAKQMPAPPAPCIPLTARRHRVSLYSASQGSFQTLCRDRCRLRSNCGWSGARGAGSTACCIYSVCAAVRTIARGVERCLVTADTLMRRAHGSKGLVMSWVRHPNVLAVARKVGLPRWGCISHCCVACSFMSCGCGSNENSCWTGPSICMAMIMRWTGPAGIGCSMSTCAMWPD